jgi:DNA-directed RNA polymerase specialized sigma24 family protein
MEDLFRARWAPSVRLATALIGERAVAEEVVQEAFLEVARRWDGLDNPEAYLRATVVNRCRSHHRRAGIARRRLVPSGRGPSRRRSSTSCGMCSPAFPSGAGPP